MESERRRRESLIAVAGQLIRWGTVHCTVSVRRSSKMLARLNVHKIDFVLVLISNLLVVSHRNKISPLLLSPEVVFHPEM